MLSSKLSISLLGSKHEIIVSRAVIRALGKPEYVCLLKNEGQQSIAIQVCDESHLMSFHVPEKLFDQDGNTKFRIYSRDFTRDLIEIANFDNAIRYTFTGTLVEEHHAVIFALSGI